MVKLGLLVSDWSKPGAHQIEEKGLLAVCQANMNDCWKRFQMGAMMGGTVGACIGVLFGTMAVMRYGHGGQGYLRTVGKMAIQSGASFGLFMGIGSFIRCDDDIPRLESPSRPISHRNAREQ